MLIFAGERQEYGVELDRPLTSLGFVDDVTVAGTEVRVALRLPTGMCSPVFAWMMASDAKAAVEDLPAVERAAVRPRDHLFAEQITEGVNAGRAFDEQFEDAETGPEQVRRKLDWKACLARAADVIESLRGRDVSPRAIAATRRDDVTLTDDEAELSLDGETVSLDGGTVSRYLERATRSGVASDPTDPLFVGQDGDPIRLSEFERVRRRLRAARVNRDNHGHRCELLLESRYESDQPA